MELLQEKYSIVQQIIAGGDYGVKEREEGIEVACVYAGTKDWITLGYNQSGEEIRISLYREYEDYCEYNNDSRTKELADWIIEIISQYDEYDPVDYLNS